MSTSPETPIRQSKRIRRFANEHPVATKALLTVAANKLGGELIWGMQGRSKLHTLPYDGPPTVAVGVTFPGMGNSGDGGKKMAQRMSEIIPNQRWTHVKYDNSRRLNIATIADSLRDYKEDTGADFLDFYTSSLGFTIALEAAAKAKTPIRALIINSSPSHISDGYGYELGSLAAKLPDTGPVGKFAGTAIADLVRHERAGFWNAVLHAGRETILGGSPKLFKSQVKILEQFDPEKHWEKYKNVINSDYTRAVYISPPNEDDNTIRVDNAYESLERFFHKFGVALERKIMKDAVHADIEKSIQPTKEWFNENFPGNENLAVSGGVR